jgi:hypothetical protein
MSSHDARVMQALGRIMRTWSLITMTPVRHLLPLQSRLLAMLTGQRDLTENELVVLGLKHLHATRHGSKEVGGKLQSTSLPRRARRSGRSMKSAPYTIVAEGKEIAASVKRRTIEGAIQAVEDYRRIGVTIITIETPDGTRYSPDQLSALRVGHATET